MINLELIKKEYINKPKIQIEFKQDLLMINNFKPSLFMNLIKINIKILKKY